MSDILDSTCAIDLIGQSCSCGGKFDKLLMNTPTSTILTSVTLKCNKCRKVIKNNLTRKEYVRMLRCCT